MAQRTGRRERSELEDLFEKLRQNRDSGIYPYHMPGHKRRACGSLSRALCGLDITEIEGFDNLHQPRDILLRLQQRAARLYGAEESYYLVNGSTAGVLAAVSAALPLGGHLLLARNSHKSAYHGAYLRRLKLSYLYPPFWKEWDILDGVTPKQVARALERDASVGAVLLVSPTYEGRISDIPAIAEIVHEKGIPLIVDEAHGAHLGFGGVTPKNSCRAGADLVIHSVHKTLPALTQAALLHVNGNRVDRERLRRFLRVYQSSSPSYLLMAGIDNALRFVEQDGEKAFERFQRLYGEMLRRLAACERLRFPPWDRERQDIGKLVISVKDSGISGRELYDILLNRYGLQLEMAAESFGLALFTVNDSRQGYERMTRALLELDKELALRPSESVKKRTAEEFAAEAPAERMPLWAAWEKETKEVLLEESPGHCAGDFLNLYPPGVPVLVPGEVITGQMCRLVKQWLRLGLTVQGIRLLDDNISIKILVKE